MEKHIIKISLAILAMLAGACGAPYSPSDLNKELKSMGMEVELPPYNIVEYHQNVIEKELWYKLTFNGDEIIGLEPMLDSLCFANPNWTKEDGRYRFCHDYTDAGNTMSVLVITPKKKTATYTESWM